MEYRKYAQIWNRYLPVIRILLKKSLQLNQVLALNKGDFEKAGVKKSGYSFKIEFTKGRVTNRISESQMATELATVMQENEAVRTVLESDDFNIEMNTRYQLKITCRNAPPQPAESPKEKKKPAGKKAKPSEKPEAGETAIEKSETVAENDALISEAETENVAAVNEGNNNAEETNSPATEVPETTLIEKNVNAVLDSETASTDVSENESIDEKSEKPINPESSETEQESSRLPDNENEIHAEINHPGNPSPEDESEQPAL